MTMFMGKFTVPMAIFNRYINLPEGKSSSFTNLTSQAIPVPLRSPQLRPKRRRTIHAKHRGLHQRELFWSEMPGFINKTGDFMWIIWGYNEDNAKHEQQYDMIWINTYQLHGCQSTRRRKHFWTWPSRWRGPPQKVRTKSVKKIKIGQTGIDGAALGSCAIYLCQRFS